MAQGRRIEIEGIVQGVGFRPWVYRLAHELELGGRSGTAPAASPSRRSGTRPRCDRFVERLDARPRPPRPSAASPGSRSKRARSAASRSRASPANGAVRVSIPAGSRHLRGLPRRNAATRRIGATATPSSTAPTAARASPSPAPRPTIARPPPWPASPVPGLPARVRRPGATAASTPSPTPARAAAPLCARRASREIRARRRVRLAPRRHRRGQRGSAASTSPATRVRKRR